MATVQRHVFKHLPESLQNFLSASQSFTDLQQIFGMFLAGLKDDLAHTAQDPFKASRAFVVMEFLKAEFTQFEKEVGRIYHNQAINVLPELFEEKEVPEMALNEGYKVEVESKFFCSIKKMNRCAAYEWLKENGLGDIIQPAVHPKALNSAVFEYMNTNGVEPPQELITTFIQPTAKIKKCRGAKSVFDAGNAGFESVFGDSLAAE